MNVSLRASAPAFATGNKFQLNHSFCAQGDRYLTVETLSGKGHEYPLAALQGCQHFRPMHNLWKMRRTDFLFALRHEHKIYGRLSPGAAQSMQGGQKSRLRAFLVHFPTSDHDLAQTGLIHQRSIEGRR